jgi:glycosyltransferase involved in cell wall biosynthesis
MQNLTLVFHFGALRDGFSLLSFWQRHQKELARLGAAYSGRALAAFFQDGAKGEGARFLDGLAPHISLACIVGPNYLPLLSRQSRTGFKTRFPKVVMKAFVSFPRQDRDAECFFAWHSVAGAFPLPVARWLNNTGTSRVHDYAAGLTHLRRIFGPENVGVFVGGGAEDAGEEARARNAFWTFAGGDPLTAGAADFQSLPSAVNLAPGRDFCEFARCCIAAQEKRPAGWSTPWTKASLAFPPRPLHLFSPQGRREFLRHWEASNARLASRLGQKSVFTESANGSEPAADWRDYTGLTPEAAFAVAKRLDRDFARELTAACDAVPVRHLARDQRLVREALHDAFDAAPSVPPARPTPEPKLSVLTLAYNHAAFLAENIESVIAQQVNFPLQHIIADDGSNDGTQDIIMDYAAKYPHIVPLLRKDRAKTPWGNVRVLFDMARTEYAAICDGDDYFTDPAKLQTQADYLDRHKDCGLCFHPTRVIFEDAVKPEYLYPDLDKLPRGLLPTYSLVDLFQYNFIQTNSILYRWRFRNGLPDWFHPHLVPGDWYWHVLHAETGKIGFINKVMSVYRRHGKGVYYLLAIDPLKHRSIVGMKELETISAVNSHFNGKYESLLLVLSNGVFADCLLYDRRAKENGAEPVLDKLCAAYPAFARHFLDSLKEVSATATI